MTNILKIYFALSLISGGMFWGGIILIAWHTNALVALGVFLACTGSALQIQTARFKEKYID